MRPVLLCGLLAVLLTWASTSGLVCTPAGLPSVTDLMGTSQSDAHPATPDRQWIFPSLRFTCTANVTGWVFTAAVDDGSASVTCPTLELWIDNEVTPNRNTDYVQSESLTPSNYTQPESLSGSVYRCNLLTPLLVSTGTILGFRTISESNGATSTSRVQLITNSDAPAGYWRSMQSAGAFIDTGIIETFTGVVPLIAPVLAAEPGIGGSEATQTPLPSSLTPTLQLPPSTSTPQSTPIPPTPTFSNPTSGTSSSSLIPVVVPVATTAAVLLVAAAVLVVVIVMLARRKSRLMQQSSKARDAENGQLKKERAQVRSRNNYSLPPNHIYEDVDSMSIERKKQQQQLQHDYDYVNSVSVTATDDPKNYEVPSPSKSSNQDSSVYEVPGGMSDSMAGPGPLREGGGTVGGGVYDTPINAQGSALGGQRGEESVYETPMDAGVRRGEGEMESSGVYEVVGGREGDMYAARPHPLQTQPMDMPRRVEIRDVEHSDNSLVFLQSVSHLVASL